jgi:lysophospholipase L1-like esterase
MSKTKKVLILLITNAVIISLLLLLAEGYLVFRNRNGGMDAGWLAVDPELGYVAGSKCEGVLTEWGIRTPAFETQKPDNIFRILVIGDSVAWPKDGFVTLLREKLPKEKFEVINAAIPGYTIHQERIMAERLLVASPDLVVLQYCVNDHHKFLHEVSSNGRWLFTADAKAALDPSDNSLLSTLTRKSRLVRLIRMTLLNKPKTAKNAWTGKADVGPAWTEYGWAYYQQEFLEMNKSLGEIPLVVVAVPYKPQLKSSDEDALYPQARLAALCDETQTPLLDLTSTFKASEKKLYTDQLHLTDSGHQLVTEALETFLNKRP